MADAASGLWRRWFEALWWLDERPHALGLTCVPLCLRVGRMEARYYESNRP